MFGRDRSEMESVLGYTDLIGDFDDIGHDHPDTRLRIEVDDRDPDDAYSGAAYEKGYLFLRLIEETVGREPFDAFLKGYFETFAFQTMTTDRFLLYLRDELLSKHPGSEQQVRVMDWIDQPGLPDNHPVATSDAFTRVEAEVERWAKGTAPADLATGDWNKSAVETLRSQPAGGHDRRSNDGTGCRLQVHARGER